MGTSTNFNWMAELDEESLQIENERIIALRSKQLIGKEIQGTLICKVRSSGKQTFWVRWNKRKCDTVLVRSNLILEALNTLEPKEGTQIKCTIDVLGPELSKLAFKSAWCMHPQAGKIEVISHGYINSRVKEEKQTNCTFGLKLSEIVAT